MKSSVTSESPTHAMDLARFTQPGGKEVPCNGVTRKLALIQGNFGAAQSACIARYKNMMDAGSAVDAPPCAKLSACTIEVESASKRSRKLALRQEAIVDAHGINVEA